MIFFRQERFEELMNDQPVDIQEARVLEKIEKLDIEGKFYWEWQI